MEAQFANLRRIGGGTFVREMIEVFLENAPKQIATATTAAQSGDLNGVERSLHSLRSSAGNLGADTLKQMVKRLEQLAKEKQPGPLLGLLQDLERVFAWTRECLEEKKRQEP